MITYKLKMSLLSIVTALVNIGWYWCMVPLVWHQSSSAAFWVCIWGSVLLLVAMLRVLWKLVFDGPKQSNKKLL